MDSVLNSSMRTNTPDKNHKVTIGSIEKEFEKFERVLLPQVKAKFARNVELVVSYTYIMRFQDLTLRAQCLFLFVFLSTQDSIKPQLAAIEEKRKILEAKLKQARNNREELRRHLAWYAF